MPTSTWTHPHPHPHAPIHIDRVTVERVLGVHITEDLKWSLHTDSDKKIIMDLSHPNQGMFTSLPSRRRRQYRCIKAGTKRLINGLYL
jgi:hypothetical protein